MPKNKKSDTKPSKQYIPVNIPSIHMLSMPYDLGGLLGDAGKSLLNMAATPLEAAVGKDFYDPNMKTKIGGDINDIQGGVAKVAGAVLPAALNTVAPGSGTLLSAVQQGTNGLIEDHSSNKMQNASNLIGGISNLVSQFGEGGDLNKPKTVKYLGVDMSTADAEKLYELKNRFNTAYKTMLDSGTGKTTGNVNHPMYTDAYKIDQLHTKYNIAPTYVPNTQLNSGVSDNMYFNQYENPAINYTTPAPKVTPVVPATTPAPETTPTESNYQYVPKKFTGFTNNTYPESMQVEGYAKGQIHESGGPLDMTHYNGLKHELGGIPLGDTGHEVEDGETRVGDYIFSDSLRPLDSDKTFADHAKAIERKYGRRENDGPSDRAKKIELEKLMKANEEARISQEQSDMEDVHNYGGCIEMKNGGIMIKPENRGKFTKAAKSRGMGVQEFAKHVLANKEKYSSTLVKRANFAHNAAGWKHEAGGDMNSNYLKMLQNASAAVNNGLPSDNYFNAIKNAQAPKDAFGNPITEFQKPQEMNLEGTDAIWTPRLDTNFGIPQQRENFNESPYLSTEDYRAPMKGLPEYQSPELKTLPQNNTPSNPTGGITGTSNNPSTQKDFFDPTNKFGAKEAGLMSADAAAVYNMIKGSNPQNTQFEKFNPSELDLSMARQAMEKQAMKAKNLSNQNIRNNATTAGQALSNLSAANNSINSNLQDQILNSYAQEKMYNTNMNNQAGQMNTQIANQQIIANEQNKAMGDSLIGLGLADLGMNAQGYFRDKGMQKENSRFNDQAVNLINNMFTNYQWGKNPENDQYMINFVLPKMKGN